MRLAAIHIPEHFLFEKNFTINFGSKYFYNISLFKDKCLIERNENIKYIPNFFSSEILKNISAIVGTNGSGKTTVLNEIAYSISSSYGSHSIMVFEKENGEVIIHNTKHSNISANFIYEKNTIDIQTIYYSPFLDFKTSYSGIDLSFDNIIKNDLEYIDNVWEGNNKIMPYERLRQRNYKRYRNFKNSEFSKSIAQNFDFPEDNLHRVTFTRYRIDSNEKELNLHNTPMDYWSFLDKLFLKIRKESSEINRNVDNDIMRFRLQKDLYKNYFLMDIFCLLIRLMEIHNTYLNEGHFNKFRDYQVQEKLFKNNNAFDLIKIWLNDHIYVLHDIKSRPLPTKEVIELIDFVYEYIDKLECDKLGNSNLFDWHSMSLYFETEKLDQLFLLEKRLINKLQKYYLPRGEKNFTYHVALPEIAHFVNLEFSNRSLSSGETAMLNLFSRIYEYFDKNILSLKTEKKHEIYLLLLDEADLGFHPQWKKNFISLIKNFTDDFFSKIGSKIQIIFTTHDPFTLSDLPNYNVTYIDKNRKDSYVIPFDDIERPIKTFAANITDLLSDSFFLRDGLIGDFAKEKINVTIDWLNDKERNNENSYYHLSLINLIDEPLLKNKLLDMYYEIYPDEINIQKNKERLLKIAKTFNININFEDK